MKKILLFLFFAGMAATAVAQRYVDMEDYYTPPPKRYIHLGYVLDQWVDFLNSDFDDYGEPYWAVSFEAGTTYFLNRVPWAGMLRLGIDHSYLDLQYSQYCNRIAAPGGSTFEQIDSHFGTVGMQVGPSLTISPTRHVHLKAYVRYVPTFTAFASEDWKNIVGGYAGYVSGGTSASWRMLTLGWEARTNAGNGNLFEIETDGDAIAVSGTPFGEKQRMKAPSMRIYLGFRF